MTVRSNGLKGVMSIGLTAVICGALLSCGGPVGSPAESAGKAPDLVVTPPSASDSGPAAGAPFTLSATVRNAGDGASEATTLRYYRSADAIITTSDAQVGTDEVAQLAASGSSDESVSLTAPSTAGTYYYGACVDAVPGESDTTNNCSSFVQINVPEQIQAGPNLVVGAPSVSDSGPAAGKTFTLSATVRNDGSETSAATTLRYYRSTDASITTSDTLVGSAAVAGLGASGSIGQSLDVSAPSTPGTYYYGACVEAVTDESDTTDNCSSSVQIKVPQPDLVVAAASVSNSAPAVGATFTLSATVSNDGDEASAVTTLRYYRSTDATITTSDTLVATEVVTGLDTSGSSSQAGRLFVASGSGTYYYHGEVEVTAPSTAGTYYYGACVDAVTDESETTNNCSSSVRVRVLSSEPSTQGTPDLEAYAIVVATGLDGFTPGVSFTLSVGVRNDGSESSAATTLRYYRSTDSTITTSDTEVGTDEVPGLAPSGTSTQSVSLNAPSTPGTYYYGACVDAVTDESDTTNNCIAHQIDVSEESQGAPDLVVAAPTVSDNGPDAGATFTLSATVRNAGDESSAATTLRYYRSTDATITTSDTQVGTDEVAELAASGTSSESVSLTAPSTPGTYYYGACVDTVTDESDTTNNCSSSVQVTVPEPKPDLVLAAPTVSNGAPAVEATFTLSATVRNDGDESSAATTLRYYRSADATITTSDTQVGTDAVAGLAASGTSSESVSLTAPSTPGTYYYGACVDAVTDESDTTNNCSSSVQVTVTAPDLVVGTPSVTDSTPDAGATFTDEVGAVCDGEKRRERIVGGHDAALLPFDGRDRHDIRHAGGHGRRGRSACGFGDQQRVGEPDRAIDSWDVLLRSLRGRGGG